MVAAQGTDERLRFLSEAAACEVKDSYGTPAYVYSEAALKSQAETALAFPSAYGLTVRFAMKACPNAAVLQTFDRLGLHVDASSGYEVRRDGAPLGERAAQMTALDHPRIDWVALAQSYGVPASRAETAQQLQQQLQAAFAGSGPALIEMAL